MNPIVKLARQQILRVLDGQTVQVPTSVGLLEVSAKADDHWTPLRQAAVSEHIWQTHVAHNLPVPDQVWTNGEYEVFVAFTPEGGAHLSIKRLDRAPLRNWRHFQQIKNEILGEEVEALELFPAESRLVDNANQFHLWAMPSGVAIPMGFSGGFVTLREEEVYEWNEAGGKGRQEPLQPGLTTGATMQEAQDREGVSSALAKSRQANR